MSGLRRSGQRHGGGAASAAAGTTAAVYSDGAPGGRLAPNGTQGSAGPRGRGLSQESGQTLRPGAPGSSQNTKGPIGASRKGATEGCTRNTNSTGPCFAQERAPCT